MNAPIKPNVNDLNVPDKKDIAPFEKPKDVTWEPEDQAKFASFDFMDVELHGDEAIARIKKRKELSKLLGTVEAKPVKEAHGEAAQVCYAKANQESKKGEDAAAAILPKDSAPAAFAIFDGHSGKKTAQVCSETICQRLMEKVGMPPPPRCRVAALPCCLNRPRQRRHVHRPCLVSTLDVRGQQAGEGFTPKAIKDVLWAVDEEIGTTGAKDGATAQLLLVEKLPNGNLKGTFAWCGDSSAVVADTVRSSGSYRCAHRTARPCCIVARQLYLFATAVSGRARHT
jgi:hypothetical protein